MWHAWNSKHLINITYRCRYIENEWLLYKDTNIYTISKQMLEIDNRW